DWRRIRLAGEPEESQVSLAQCAIFVGLRREGCEPLFEVAVLKRTRQSVGHLWVRPWDRIGRIDFRGIGVAPRERRCVTKCRRSQGGFTSIGVRWQRLLQEEVGL